ncbi:MULTISPECIES: hypothetical protein [Sphingobium]|uniref:Uncharacterized protein n=1 Tax=Sphingobium agri TaxID=2933566 RepID=A0ABT0DZ85_9SPHN|nr:MULTISPECIES: hypothetical protein [Sphingobium]MCK0532436.1 hypothetical protein [Sphingobium agri]QPI73373.1 hypothetical protein IZV00_02390 [Sphingobium sp. Cam5-1]
MENNIAPVAIRQATRDSPGRALEQGPKIILTTSFAMFLQTPSNFDDLVVIRNSLYFARFAHRQG